MRIKTETRMLEDEDLRQEYMEMLKKNPDKIISYTCGFCLSTDIVVNSEKEDRMNKLMGNNSIKYDRACPSCSNFMSLTFEVDLTLSRRYFETAEVV